MVHLINLEQIVDDWTKKHTRQALATQVGCTLVTLNKKISGESELTFGEFERLATALEMTLEGLANAIHTTNAQRNTQVVAWVESDVPYICAMISLFYVFYAIGYFVAQFIERR